MKNFESAFYLDRIAQFFVAGTIVTMSLAAMSVAISSVIS